MQYLSIALPLAALVSGALAKPPAACTSNACLAVVTGKAALGDDGLRKFHCASYLQTTVTPPAITITETVTGEGKHGLWPRASVTVCPNEVPNYASACNDAAYSSACACFGFTEVKTTTLAPTTTTKTVYVKPTAGCTDTKTITATVVTVSGSTCPAASTVTSTKTVGGGGHGGATETETETVTTTKTVGGGGATPSTVTVTVGGCSSSTTSGAPSSSSSAPSKCVVDGPKATQLVESFLDLLRFTSFPGNATTGIPAGSGYHQDVSDAILTPNFVDISDSINFMAGFPLGSVTFPSKQYFDIGQGQLQPEVAVDALNIWYDCNIITFRWRIYSTRLPVTGINVMLIDANGKIEKNYAEFDNGAWLQSFGRQCATNAPPPPQSPPALKRALTNFALLD